MCSGTGRRRRGLLRPYPGAGTGLSPRSTTASPRSPPRRAPSVWPPGGTRGRARDVARVPAPGVARPAAARLCHRRTGHRENHPGRRLPAAGHGGRAGHARRRVGNAWRATAVRKPITRCWKRSGSCAVGPAATLSSQTLASARADLAGAVSRPDDPRPPRHPATRTPGRHARAHAARDRRNCWRRSRRTGRSCWSSRISSGSTTPRSICSRLWRAAGRPPICCWWPPTGRGTWPCGTIPCRRSRRNCWCISCVTSSPWSRWAKPTSRPISPPCPPAPACRRAWPGWSHRHSEGNPLFMRAALDHLTQQGLLAREPDRWQLRVPLEDIDLGVPESLRQVIEAQIARLSPEEQRALEVASVTGAVFTASVSAAAADLETNDLKTCATRWRGGSTWCARRVRSSCRTGASPSAMPLSMRCTARCAMGGRRRGAGRRLHRRIGERLEALFAAQLRDVAPELAHHFEAGAEWARAVTVPAAGGGDRRAAVCPSGSGGHAAARPRRGAHTCPRRSAP